MVDKQTKNFELLLKNENIQTEAKSRINSSEIGQTPIKKISSNLKRLRYYQNIFNSILE
jgi:hypothetical protein